MFVGIGLKGCAWESTGGESRGRTHYSSIFFRICKRACVHVCVRVRVCTCCVGVYVFVCRKIHIYCIRVHLNEMGRYICVMLCAEF